jgi:hypothetical protein
MNLLSARRRKRISKIYESNHLTRS